MGKEGEITADASDANNQATTAKFRKKLNTQPRGTLPQESTPFNVEKLCIARQRHGEVRVKVHFVLPRCCVSVR